MLEKAQHQKHHRARSGESNIQSVDVAAMLCANGLDPVQVKTIPGSTKANFVFVESDEFTQLMALLRKGEVEVNFRHYQDCRSYLIGLHARASEAAA